MIVPVPDLQEEILVRLPLKSIIRFKSVSKRWRSILESKSFSERRRMILNGAQKKKLQFLGAARNNRTVFQWLGDKEEVEILYLDCNLASRPSLSCDGLLCIPVPGWITVLNPSTREFLKFASGRDPWTSDTHPDFVDRCFEVFPGYWRMGFGRDKVNGNYKVVRMFFEPNYYCEILDINIGEWRKPKSPPLFYVGQRLKSTCVNGSIYWLEIDGLHFTQKILAFDLSIEEFRSVRTPPSFCMSGQIANLEDRLVVAAIDGKRLNIWRMDEQEETWTITYSFDLFTSNDIRTILWWEWCMPLYVSKGGDLFFHDRKKNLQRYCPETGVVKNMTHEICVISPFVENLLPLRCGDPVPKTRTFGFQELEVGVYRSRISKVVKGIESSISDVLRTDVPISHVFLTTIVVTLLIITW